MRDIVDIVNELTKHNTNSTENFLKSLKFIDNALTMANFFKKLANSDIEYHIIKGFDYKENNNNFSEFKVVYFVCESNNIEDFINSTLKLTKISNFYVLTII